jgi:branched-chain amino acid transport system substrate-binding protein
MTELKKRGGDDAESTAAAVYSTFLLLADAVKRAGSLDPAKVRDALAATKDFPAMHGKLLGFDSQREIVMAVPVIVIKDGAFTHLVDISDPFQK